MQDLDGDEALLSAESCARSRGADEISQRFCDKHEIRLQSKLESMPKTYRNTATRPPTRPEIDGMMALQVFTQISKSSMPPIVNHHSSSARSQAYEECVSSHQESWADQVRLMTLNRGRDTESAAGVFYEGPLSQVSILALYSTDSHRTAAASSTS